MARKFVISPTKLRTFHQCAAKYRLEYVDKIGRFYHRARAGQAFGQALHRALDSFHNAGGAATITATDLTQALETVWVAKGYENPAQEAAFREEGQRILQQYHAEAVAQQEEQAQTRPDIPLPHLLYTEKTLRIDLSPMVALTGRIDRVDEHHDGTLEIVDYKSGRDTVTEEDVAESLALGVYQLLLKHTHPTRRVFATLVALRTGARASHELDETERADLHAECADTGETLRTKDWENVLPVVNDHCPYCDFLPHCERFWRRQKRYEE